MFTDEGSGLDSVDFFMDGVKIPSLSLGEGVICARLLSLDEGDYTITAVATDKAGGKTEKEISFTVDTSEIFGDKTLRPGAKGRDVERLQEQLIDLGFLKEGKVTGIYDEDTVEAVTTYQKAENKEVSTVLDRDGLLVFCNKIKIYLDEHMLYLISPGDKLIKSYSIACGAWGYPTPTGSYYIKDKEMHPTWYPPPAPWAKGLKPIPPGWDNPLGTRWMGLSDHDIGIHGTSDPGSIGTSASHGCIRMLIDDAEKLYELVQVGTPVDIYSQRPDSDKYGLEEDTDDESIKPDEKLKLAANRLISIAVDVTEGNVHPN